MKRLCFITIFACVVIHSTELKAQNSSVKLPDGLYVTADEGIKIYDKNQDNFFYLDKTSLIAIKHVKSTEVKKTNNLSKKRYELSLSLDGPGTSALAKFSPNFDMTINIVLVVKGKLLFVAKLFNKITSGNMSFSSGTLTQADLEGMKLEIDKAAGIL